MTEAYTVRPQGRRFAVVYHALQEYVVDVDIRTRRQAQDEADKRNQALIRRLARVGAIDERKSA
jgi:hypothetical protein